MMSSDTELLEGKLLFDTRGGHTFQIEDGLIRRFDIRPEPVVKRWLSDHTPAQRPRPGATVRHDVYARPTNSRVSVCTFTRSPSLTNSGTRTSRPVSSVAAFVTLPLLVSPRTAGSV
jgi:hypothetical protein